LGNNSPLDGDSSSLPPPPNYASVILEIQQQQNQQLPSLLGASALPPPTYSDILQSSNISKGHHHQPAFTLCHSQSRTLGRTLGEEKDQQQQQRGSLRRIASDLTARDIARMLRASFRRTNAAAVANSSRSDATAADAATSNEISFTRESGQSQAIIAIPVPGPSSSSSSSRHFLGRNRNSAASTAALIFNETEQSGSEFDTQNGQLHSFPRSRMDLEDLEEFHRPMTVVTLETWACPSHPDDSEA
jgi:hypothetical protein